MLKIKLFVASIIKDVSKETGREYVCVQGKIFPKQRGFGERFFFDYVLARDVREQAITQPFEQNSTLEVEFGYDAQILRFKVIEKGNGPAAIKNMQEVYASAAARKTSGSAPTHTGSGKAVPVNESCAR
jgi:hypothetical protein